MKVVPTELPGVIVFEPRKLEDDRGFFLETFHAARYAEAGVKLPFVQDNWSHSKKGALRGLHFQEPKGQGKLVHVVTGKVFDVAVDVRKGSQHFGRWVGVELSAENKRQLWLPPGFAHGFYVMSDEADFLYKCTEVYAPEADRGILWNDPAIGIRWPLDGEPLLSAKDAKAPRLADAPVLPKFQAP